MWPLWRLSALIREQLFLMSKRTSFTSATALVPPSSKFTTTQIHPWRKEHRSSIRCFYQEWEWPETHVSRFSICPTKHLVYQLLDLFAVVSKHSASSCLPSLVYSLELQPLDLRFSRWSQLGRWLPRPTLIPIASINPWSKAFPLPFSWPTGSKNPLSPCSKSPSSVIQRGKQLKNLAPGLFPLPSVETQCRNTQGHIVVFTSRAKL